MIFAGYMLINDHPVFVSRAVLMTEAPDVVHHHFRTGLQARKNLGPVVTPSRRHHPAKVTTCSPRLAFEGAATLGATPLERLFDSAQYLASASRPPSNIIFFL